MYLMLKANDRRNHNERVNWYYQSALTDDADWHAIEAEAAEICRSKGWSLINVRDVPEATALERVADQDRDATNPPS